MNVYEDRHPLGGQRNQEAKQQSSRAWSLRVVGVENLTSASQAMSHVSNCQDLNVLSLLKV